MARHQLIAGPNGDLWLFDEILIVRYPEGDCDSINRRDPEWKENLHRCLYDLYQCDERIAEGDEFVLGKKVLFRASGVHVVEA